jgi:hypothetical protein
LAKDLLVDSEDEEGWDWRLTGEENVMKWSFFRVMWSSSLNFKRDTMELVMKELSVDSENEEGWDWRLNGEEGDENVVRSNFLKVMWSSCLNFKRDAMELVVKDLSVDSEEEGGWD